MAERRREEEDGEKAEGRRKILFSAETERHEGAKWAGHPGAFWRHFPLSISTAAQPNGLKLTTLRLAPRSIGDPRAEGRVQGGQKRPPGWL